MPANTKKLTYAQVYDTLSKVNVNEFCEEKMGLTYLSWSQAVRIFTEHFPEWSLKWHGTTDANDVLRDVTYYEGGTAAVTCTVSIPDGAGGELKREMWLPVLDFKNRATAYPDSMAINTAKMRCWVKNMAIWGLGLYVYSGLDETYGQVSQEDQEPAPEPPKKKRAPRKKKATKEGPNPDELKQQMVALSKDLGGASWEPDDSLKKDIKQAVASGDADVMAAMVVTLQKTKDMALKLHDEREEK